MGATEVLIWVLVGVAALGACIVIAQNQRDSRDWYVNALDSPTDYTGSTFQASGNAFQRMSENGYLFMSSLDGQVYYIELVEGAFFNEVHQGDDVTLGGVLGGLYEYTTYGGEHKRIPYIKANYIQVTRCVQPLACVPILCAA